MVDWSKIGRHAQYGNGLKRAKYRGWLYPVVVVVGSLLVHLLQDDRRRSLAKTNIVVYVFGSILHVVPWETPRAYVLALAADFCAITGVYTTHVRAYCRSTAPASTLSLWMTTTLILVQFVSLLRKRDLQYDQMNRAVRVLCGFGQNFLLAAVEVLRIPPPLGWGVALSKVLLFLYFFVGGRAYAASFLCRIHAIDASARWRLLDGPPRHRRDFRSTHRLTHAGLDSKFKWTFGTVPGVWEVHDNVHVLALCIHLAQVYAVGLERREESAFC